MPTATNNFLAGDQHAPHHCGVGPGGIPTNATYVNESDARIPVELVDETQITMPPLDPPTARRCQVRFAGRGRVTQFSPSGEVMIDGFAPVVPQTINCPAGAAKGDQTQVFQKLAVGWFGTVNAHVVPPSVDMMIS
jgi:hypothetical protein